MADVVLRTEALTKFYGRDRGIVDVDVEIRPGEVFGFLGPNGAGKTTTIRLLLDLIRPTRGRAVLFGLDSHRDSLAIRRRVGYLPGELRLYDSLSGRELLDYFGHLRGRPVRKRAAVLAEQLDCDLTREIRTLSHGNRQKLGLIQALMNAPEFLILDEPTLGLDPLIQHEFFRLLDEARAAGQTVFLSSHNLPEIERAWIGSGSSARGGCWPSSAWPTSRLGRSGGSRSSSAVASMRPRSRRSPVSAR